VNLVNRWKAADDRVVVQRTQTGPKTTESGIVIPESKAKRTDVIEGVVLAVGPKARGVKVGDHAFLVPSGAIEVVPGVWSVNADFVAAVVREEAE